MPMSISEYNRSRPGSSLGTNHGTNGAGSTWKRSVAGTVKSTGPPQARTSHDIEYDSDDLDFEAYKKNRFPSAVADSAQGRSASALGMSANVEYSSNEALASTANASDIPPRSRSISNPPVRPTAGPRRLQNMLQTLNARSSTNTSSRPTGLPNGRSTNLRAVPETIQSQSQTISQPDLVATSTIEAPRAAPASISTISTTTTASSSSPIERPGLARSASALSQKEGTPKSPASIADSDEEVSIDVGSYENGIAARRYFRVLDAKCNVLRDAWRKDPKNAGLSDYDLNQGAKSIEFEDPEEQKLYEELRHYVVRDGKLGPEWEKYCLSIGRRVDDDFVLSDDEEDDFRYAIKQIEPEDEDSGVQTGKYHDAIDDPLIETIDLASFDEEPRARSTERAGHNRIRSGATTAELALANGPQSASSSGPGYRPWAPAASPPEERQLIGLPRPRSGAGTRPSNPPQPSYQSEYKQTYPTHQQDTHQQEPSEDDDEEYSPPLPGGKFENLALNDTLQLRQQRTPWSTLPPDAIVYEPPPPPAARSTRNRKEPTFESGFTTARPTTNAATTVERDRIAPLRSSAQPSANAASTKNKQRFTSSQTVHAPPPQSQSLAHQQRLTKSAGKRRVEERDYGTNSGAEERRAAGLQRTGSGKGMRGEEEGRDSGAEQHGYTAPSRDGAAFQQSVYQEPQRVLLPRDQQYQPHRHYPGSHMYEGNDGLPMHFMRASHPAPAPLATNGQQYYGGVNGGYNAQGQDSSPIEASRQGQNTVTPGATGEKGLVRANTMPAGGNGVIPADQQKNLVMINKHQYLRLEVIGRGGSSKVFRVIRTKDWKTFAMKKVVLSAIDDEAMRSYATEIQMLKRLSGNNSIVRLIDDELRGKGSGTLFLVMELGETDFNRLLYERQGTAISIPWITLYFKQMLEAVNVIHEERIVHSDLKPANFVLIRNTLKLIDFGIAKAIANDTTNIQRDSQIGTLNYMSPETMNAAPGDDRLKIGRPSDVWSLGCILYQMVYGAAPFAAFSLQQKMIAIAREEHLIDYPEYSVPVVPKEKTASGRPEYREELKVKVPREMIGTMKACLNREAKRRPTIALLLKEGWLEGLYGNESSSSTPLTPPPSSQTLALASDEAVISSHYMLQLINYCFRSYDPNWDEEDGENMQKVERMAAQVMPQLQALRPNEQ